jgi:hypothetical protein
MNQCNIIFGDFDSERFWRPKSLATLPIIVNPQSRNIVMAMDELFSAFCNNSNDYLISRYKFELTQLEYLGSLGIKFNNDFVTNGSNYSDSLDKLILSEEKLLKDLSAIQHKNIVNYSLQKETDKFRKFICDKSFIPNLKLVVELNSKEFSFKYRTDNNYALGFHTKGLSSFKEKGTLLLNSHGAIVIKDLFGVSGNGNYKIETEKIFSRIIRYLEKQEEIGKTIDFIIEPFLIKKIDFSCLVDIAENGSSEILFLNKLENIGFSFNKISRLSSYVIAYLEKMKYFDYITRLSRYIGKLGYKGPLCIDSMITKSGDLIPIVEINARYSMGFIFQKFVNRFSNNKASLMYFNILIHSDSFYINLFKKLRKNKLLFGYNSDYGIVPFSPNSTMINYTLKNNPAYGRLFFLVFYKNREHETSIINQFKVIINNM